MKSSWLLREVANGWVVMIDPPRGCFSDQESTFIARDAKEAGEIVHRESNRLPQTAEPQRSSRLHESV